MKGSGKEKKLNNKSWDINKLTYTIPIPIGDNKKTTQTFKGELITKALDCHAQGKILEASKYYQLFIDNGLTDPRIFSNYGTICQQAGKIKQAISLYKRSINLFPKSPEAHLNLGNILREIGNLSEAEISMRKAIELKPSSANAYLNLGNILRDLGRLPEAELSTRKAIGIKPDFVMAHSNLGIILKDLRKLSEAELAARKAIELNPKLAMSHSNLGTILQDLGKLQEAEKSQRQAIQLNPKFAMAYSNLGGILKELGELKQAEISILKAIELQPKFAKSHAGLGSVLKDLGKLKEAKDSFIRALNLDPSLESAIFNLGEINYYEKNYELSIKYLKISKSDRCKALHIGSLLCLDQEEEFHKEYNSISDKGKCNAEIGGIIEHANIIYETKNNSLFCNKAIDYILFDKISKEAFSNENLNQLISYLHSGVIAIRSQSILHAGFQTSGNLFALKYPFIQSLKKSLEEKINLYKLKFADSKQGFINNWPQNYELRAWIISMKKGGFLKQHNHGYGWITGSFYLQVPKRKSAEDFSGAISFSYAGPYYPNKEKNFNQIVRNLETRDLCIFPSSLFHNTIPFESEEDRICFVFDLAPIFN